MRITSIQGELKELLKKKCRTPGADEKTIVNLGKVLGIELPTQYREFLRLTDGYEGILGRSYVALWSCTEVPKRNKGLEVAKYMPGLVIFGSDGANTAYGFDIRSSTMPIVDVEYIVMKWNAVRPMGKTFMEFLKFLHKGGHIGKGIPPHA